MRKFSFKKFKKSSIITVALVALIIVTAVSAFAILTSSANKSNQITIGTQTIEISEDKFDISSDDVIKDGEPIDKNPTIKNTGTEPCYVRAYIGCSKPSFLDESVTIAVNNGWIQASDGYYYYENALLPDEEVELFPEITVSGVETFDCDIFIHADSINASNSSMNNAWKEFGVDISGLI